MLTALLRTSKTPREGRFSLGELGSWVGAALLILGWLTTEHFLPWVSWHAEAASFCAVAFLAWSALARTLKSGSSSSIRAPALCLPFALFSVVALAQLAMGLMAFGGDVVVVVFYSGLCIVSLILGFNEEVSAGGMGATSARWTSVEILALAFVAGTLCSVVIAFAQVFDLWEHSAAIVRVADFRRPGGNLGQPNQLATLIVMGIASIAFLHVSGKASRGTAILILLVQAAGLTITESRTGVLALLAVVGWWQWKRREVAPRVSIWAAPLLAMGFIVMVAAWPAVLSGLQLGGNVTNRISQGDIRFAMWAQLLEAIEQRPWVGWGITETAKAHNAVADRHPVNNPFSYSHNIVIDWAVWMGIPIALALVVSCATWVLRRAGQIDRAVPWYCFAVAVPLAVHSLLEFPYTYAYFLAPVLFLLGVLERGAGARTVVRVRPVIAAVALLVATGAMVVAAAEYLRIEEDFRVVRFEQLRIGHTPVGHQPVDVLLFTQLGALISGSRIEIRPGMTPAELDALKKLALRYPWVNTQYRYALALALNGDQAEARRQLQVLRWLRGEGLYARIKSEYAVLARTRYPQLGTLNLP